MFRVVRDTLTREEMIVWNKAKDNYLNLHSGSPYKEFNAQASADGAISTLREIKKYKKKHTNGQLQR